MAVAHDQTVMEKDSLCRKSKMFAMLELFRRNFV